MAIINSSAMVVRGDRKEQATLIVDNGKHSKGQKRKAVADSTAIAGDLKSN
jgi:hypothetical protein